MKKLVFIFLILIWTIHSFPFGVLYSPSINTFKECNPNPSQDSSGVDFNTPSLICDNDDTTSVKPIFLFFGILLFYFFQFNYPFSFYFSFVLLFHQPPSLLGHHF